MCRESVGGSQQPCPPAPREKNGLRSPPYIEDLLPARRLLNKLPEGCLHRPSQANVFSTFEIPKSDFEVDFQSHTPRGSADMYIHMYKYVYMYVSVFLVTTSCVVPIGGSVQATCTCVGLRVWSSLQRESCEVYFSARKTFPVPRFSCCCAVDERIRLPFTVTGFGIDLGGPCECMPLQICRCPNPLLLQTVTMFDRNSVETQIVNRTQ